MTTCLQSILLWKSPSILSTGRRGSTGHITPGPVHIQQQKPQEISTSSASPEVQTKQYGRVKVDRLIIMSPTGNIVEISSPRGPGTISNNIQTPSPKGYRKIKMCCLFISFGILIISIYGVILISQ
tara:strand:+ start:183 stop:560 length:378 start_codon:yes stop_codon:yes gene_type:complete